MQQPSGERQLSYAEPGSEEEEESQNSLAPRGRVNRVKEFQMLMNSMEKEKWPGERSGLAS